ncbi:MAG: diguanylate cyclase (GGDEF)-like protein [Gammaproteobacteria bacterium]
MAHDSGEQLVVMVLGIVRFRQTTESLGLSAGDEVLREFGRRLQSVEQQTGTIVRLDREEFLVSIRNASSLDARRWARHFISQATRSVRLNDAELNIDVAAGIAIYPTHGGDVDTLMRRANIALGDAKNASNRVHLYQDGQDNQHMRQLKIVGDLKRAVHENELTLHNQSKVVLSQPGKMHAEALVLWIHPELGFLPPDEFIELAERSGNIALLTDGVLASAITQIRTCQDQGLDADVSVNLSAIDALDEQLPDRISALLARSKIPADKLVHETIVSSTIVRAHGMGLEVTAEGVESAEALQLLEAMGCDLAQGFHISRPVTVDDATRWFSERAKQFDCPEVAEVALAARVSQ